MGPSSFLADYDKWMVHPLHAAFFNHSDFYNYGYSTNETDNQEQACINLMERLLALLPARNGTILDVACGVGASTRHLLNYYRPADVTAINLSDFQLERARQNASGCRFLNMDAARLAFADASFDNIICVESAFHFQTRECFLEEALRVLKPGGHLVLSDILGRFTRRTDPNYLRGPAHYTALLSRVGFIESSVWNATDECSRRCGRRLRRWPNQAREAGRLVFSDYARAWIACNLYSVYMWRSQRCYLIASATKASRPDQR